MAGRPKRGDPLLNLPIVVWAPNFDEKSGGCIVLHLLAHKLRDLGLEVYVAYTPKPPPRPERNLSGRIVDGLLSANRRWLGLKEETRQARRPMRAPRAVVTHPTMPLPGMPDLHGRRFIAVYPEIVDGNPFGADHIARWLLYRPGFHAPEARFTRNELVFYYSRAFLTEGHDLPEDRLLQIHWVRDDIYRDLGLGNRHGTCRMVRKGTATFDPGMATGDRFGILDSSSHEEIAQAFNQCDVFVSHDPHTFYLYYAALCGCVPMVVPAPGLDSRTWRESYEMPFGVAYGKDELDWARATRADLLAEMEAVQERQLDMVKSFARKLEAQFAPTAA